MTTHSKMANAPVYYVLAQAQFNTVANMERYVPEIQDLMRKAGFTIFEEQRAIELHFTQAPNQPPQQPELKEAKTWLFLNSERSLGYVLTPSSIVCHTTHYGTGQTFLPNLIKGLAIVHEVVTLNNITRLGLRYLDAITPSKDKTVDEYLNKGLHGLSINVDNFKSLQSTCETVFQTDFGFLIVRLHKRKGKIAFPPDLPPHGLKLMERFSSLDEGDYGIIDTDHFRQENMDVNLNDIEVTLNGLHAGIRVAFDSSVSTFAKGVWA